MIRKGRFPPPDATFTVGGVEYTVGSIDLNINIGRMDIAIEPNVPPDTDFVLELDGDPFSTSNASLSGGDTRYLWTNTNLDWFVGEEVEVRLVPTVNICDRTWAVREAILAATPNRDDTCEAVSVSMSSDYVRLSGQGKCPSRPLSYHRTVIRGTCPWCASWAGSWPRRTCGPCSCGCPTPWRLPEWRGPEA